MAGTSVVVDLLIKARDLASGPLRAIVASIQFLDSEISVVAGKIRDAFGGAFGGGLDGAIEFEAQLSKVAAKGGFTAAEMEKLKQAATDIGAEFGTTGTEAAQGMEALAAAGLNATEVMQALPPVLALAQAEGISMDAAAKNLSDSLSSVGLGFSEAARMADVLAEGANLSTTSASALGVALAGVGGIANTAGLSLEETVAALVALAKGGFEGEKAGTALSAILTQLQNPASQASRELSKLGITSRDLGTVIGELAAKGDANNAAILAFGETAGPGLRKLLGQGQQSLTDFTGQLNDSDGAAKKAADGISGNLKGALGALTAAWENVKTALFEPVLEPLAEQANALSKSLNDNLASGALKSVQEAIRSLAVNGLAAIRDFISGFDFRSAATALQDFATSAKDAFIGIRDAGKTSVDVVTIAWNGFTAGFKTVGAALLAVASSAVQTLANIEGAAAKIGLGSVERAKELQESANGLMAKASELTQSVARDGAQLKTAFDSLIGSSAAGAAAAKQFADAQQGVKDSSPVVELQTINKALADYQGMAAQASAAAERARAEYVAGKISAGEYGQALLAAADANADLALATDRQAETERRASPQRKQTAVELESIATATQNTADQQGKYTSALEKAGDAQADAVRAEIELARAKGDTATVAQKTIKLAALEAKTAAEVAAAKAAEAAELAKVVVAQQAYLAAVGGGTQAQQQELQILQLKLVALQAEAAQAGKTAEAKALAEKQTAANTQTTQAHTAAVATNVEAQENQVKVVDNVRKMALGLAEAVNSARGRMDELSKAAGLFFEMTLQGTLNAQGLTGAFTAAGKAANDFLNATRGGSDALAGFEGKAAQAAAAEGRLRQELVFSVNMMDTYATAIELAEARTRKAFFEQASDAERLRLSIQRMAEGGRVDMGLLARASEDVKSGFDLLDEQDLAGLEGAIDAVNQKLRQMQQETEDARARLGDLNAELLEAQGQDKKAELLRQQLSFQEQLAEIEKKRQEAEALGNRELIALLDEQRETLEEINRTKISNIEAESAAADATERTARATRDLADNAETMERIHRSISGIAQTDLSGLSGQFNGITQSADRLRGML